MNEEFAAYENIYSMLEGPLAHGQWKQTVVGNLTRRLGSSIGLAAAVGFAYFLAALLSYGLARISASVGYVMSSACLRQP